MDTPSSSADVVNDHHYRLVYFSNELPSDEQISAHLRRLQALSKDRRYPILKIFLDDATDVLREELRKLPSNLLSLIAPFESIIDFAYQFGLRIGPFGGSTEGVFTCLIQLGTYISYHECPTNDPLTSPDGTLVALGSGLLTAAAVSFASRLPDLVKLGAEAIRIAFRMGLRVDQVSQRLESRRAEGPTESWAYVFSELSEDEVRKELASMNASLNFPTPSQIFLSAVSPGSVTISGPPSRLKTLVRSSELLRYAKWAPLPIFAGLCHTAHVYTRADAEAIVSATKLPTNSPYVLHTPLLSTRDGQPFAAQTPARLFEDVIFELLTGTIRWDTVIATLHDRVALQLVPEVSVKALGTPNALKSFNEAVQAHADPVRVITEDVLAQSLATPLPERAPRDPKDSKIAIVGMSCRLPGGAVSNQSFWDLLEKGLDVHRRIPADRFDVDTHWDPTGQNPNASKTPFGCFIDDPALFDAGFFNMSPREAEQTDPMHRLALVTAHEALEQAGFVPNRTPSTNLERVGVFYGQASDDYREVNAGQEIGTYFIPGGNRAFAPGRINYFYKFGGPSFSCDTACSSSLATVQIACTTLWSGDADMVIAGGVNVLTNSDGFAGLCNGHFLTQTGNCKTWDASADGYCRADGIGSVVMKRLEDAIADNDNILATVLSAATNQSAKAVSITHPHAGAQASLYKRVMDRAGVDPLDVSYVELHGTGTQAGDTTEMESVTEVFAPTGPRRRTEPLHIGAVKSNIGHGEAAAGIAALIKVLLMYRKRSIPPHTGIKTELNPALKKLLDKKRNIHIALEQTPWTPLYNTRYAVVNNFSAAGGNTTMLLEEAPVKEIQEDGDYREKHAVAVSAKSKVSLKGNLEALLAYLEENPETLLSDLAYTTSARRMHYNHRIAFSASSIDQVKKQLRSHIDSEEQIRPVPSSPPAVAFAFTGQGAFYPGMGAQLYRSVPSFRDHLTSLDGLCQQHGFPSILPVIESAGDEAQEEPAPIVTQLTITCLEIALAKYWASLGITPSVVVGASLGEYPALHVAGVLSASDTIFLVGQRAQQLEKHCQLRSHGMMAVRASVEQIAECLGDQAYEVACINAPQDTVIDGLQADIASAREKLQEQGYKCHQLDVPYAFHSSQIDPALDSYEQIASSVIFHAPQVPVISPLLSDVVFDAKTIHAKYMRRATREPVNFVGALQAAQEIGIIDRNTVWVEAGPHPVLVSFIRNCLPEVKRLAPTLRRNENNWNTLADSLAGLHSDGLTLQWNEVHRPFETSLQLLDLPSYSWNEKRYWIQYRGTWVLTKGTEISQPVPSSAVSTLTTSSIHQVLQEDVTGSTATFVARSNLMHPDLFEAANGHRMNGCGVVTSSIHGDIAFTIADHLYKKITNTSAPGINITNLTVLQGLVAQKFSQVDQLFELRATADLTTSPATTTIHWHNVNDGITNPEHFASAVIEYGDANVWLSQWRRLSHLVKSRIASLERMASEGTAAVLPRNMAYRLFNNLVDYADKYRGIQSAIMHEYEAMANVTLTTQGTGTWSVPPYFTDPVAHLAGLIMNGSDASNTIDYFYVTPGWAGLRFAKPFVKGGKYQSYVQMTPIEGQAGFWNGDVYVLQDGEIIGLVEKITFRRFPRSLLPTFFSPPDVAKPLHAAAPAVPVKLAASAAPAPVEAPKPAAPKPAAPAPVPAPKPAAPAPVPAPAKPAEPTPAAAPAAAQNPTITSAVDLIAKEAALEQSQLTDDAAFATLGVDSLMSLVLAEKFTSQLGIEVKSSIFMECETVGELKTYIEETFC